MKQKITAIENYFDFATYGTNWRTEILAGLSTYLSLAYIFIVNPAILSQAGMNANAVLFATIVASGLATVLMGVWARLPFALAPGLEMNGFFAFVVVGTLGLTWQDGLGAVLWSGVLVILFTVLPVRQAIVDAIPYGLKKAMSVSVGIFVLTIGLYLSGLVTFDDGHVQTVNLSWSPKVGALLIGVGVSAVLNARKIRFVGGFLIAIICAALYCVFHGITVTAPTRFSHEMFSAVGEANVFPARWTGFLPALLVFFLLDFYGGIGKFIGLTAATNLTKPDGSLPRLERAMNVDGIGTVMGGLLGTSSLIAYVESAIGIAMGGRTGVVAITCGVLMLLSLLFTPLIGLVPVEATSGILLYIGCMLVRDTWTDTGLRRFDHVTAVLMGALAFITFSLDKTLLLGFVLYATRQAFVSRRINPYLLGSTVLLAISVVLQYTLKE